MESSASTTTGSDALYDTPWRDKSVKWYPRKPNVHFNPNEDFITNFEQIIKLLFGKREGKAIGLFVAGLLLSSFGLSRLGSLLEIIGFLSLFRGATILRLLKRVRALQPVFDSPILKQLIQNIGEEKTRDSLKLEIENYEPLQDLLNGEVHFPRANVLLMGPIGVGKSSFFNTINSIFRGKIFNIARSGSSEHSLTTKFRRYPVISSSSNKEMGFCLCDAMGLEPNHLMVKENMKYLLEGHIQDKFLLDPSGSVSPDIPGFKKRPLLEDQIHCVAIVLDASTVDAADAIKDTIQNIKEMQTVMNSMDVPQVVILTCIDKVCKQTKIDASNALKSKLIDRTVGKVSEMLGLPQHNIFPVKNYEKECELDPNIDILTLLALKGILNNADAFLFMHRNEIVQDYSS
ncbi:interferon-induced protein 44-like [Mercenaria mercenaria]|uniref:interferon-induced protein 44-like n=1 Tax=Mercenaria mercenaria TaxID=6596 RepID=UPI00234EEBE9|nr:interferon-induced protein 44-like [Mercenaria mercenaria]XP_053395401.1 interferon-induced protein 44-like [Mercenaria mercenaria]XP_053395402.1 interferon-induced protein 44-like [Mercenaria mercenaria]